MSAASFVVSQRKKLSGKQELRNGSRGGLYALHFSSGSRIGCKSVGEVSDRRHLSLIRRSQSAAAVQIASHRDAATSSVLAAPGFLVAL